MTLLNTAITMDSKQRAATFHSKGRQISAIIPTSAIRLCRGLRLKITGKPSGRDTTRSFTMASAIIGNG
jgi:hypothetical protein